MILPKKNRILAVYLGHIPEEETRCYYLITKGFPQKILDDGLSDIDIRLNEASDTYFEILLWPLGPRRKSDRKFLGKPIWSRYND